MGGGPGGTNINAPSPWLLPLCAKGSAQDFFFLAGGGVHSIFSPDEINLRNNNNFNVYLWVRKKLNKIMTIILGQCFLPPVRGWQSLIVVHAWGCIAFVAATFPKYYVQTNKRYIYCQVSVGLYFTFMFCIFIVLLIRHLR